MDPRAVRESYDRIASQYADNLDDELRHRPLERALLEALPELAGIDAMPGMVADLGGGPGHIARHLRAAGVSTMSIDLSPAMAAVAQGRNQVPSAAGSLTELPLATGSLAAAVLFYSVIHLDDASLAAAARELARVLRPSGVAILSIHIGDEMRHLDEWHGQPVDLDFRFFQPSTLWRTLTQGGLLMEATLEREPIPDVEAQTRRAYLLARRP